MLNADVADGYASVNGLRLHYREWPNDGAPTVLLLHGLACHARMWDSFANSLSHDHRIIALDARGHGESDHATDYSSARHIEDLSGFIEQLRLRDLTIVGHSSGSWYARRYAVQRPKALNRLVMVDEALPHPEQSSIWPTAVAPPIEVFDDRQIGIASFIAWLTSLTAGPEPGSDPSASAHEWDNFFRWNITTTTDGRFTWRWDARMLQPRPPSASRAQMSYAEAVAEDWRAFSQVEIPILIVRGGLSRRLTPETVTLMAERFPNVQVVEVAGAGHMVLCDEPHRLRDVVDQFLARPAT